jgi:parvulin-like peptidyl-prolyl isomerase
MKQIRLFALLLLLASAIGASESNRILLRVNDRIATLYDYELRRDERLRAIQRADLDPAQRAQLVQSVGVEVLTNMLEELLVQSRADQIGYQPSEAEKAEAVRMALQQFGITNDAEFEQALRSTGMTREEFETQIEVNMRVSNVMGGEVRERVDLDEEDLRRFYYEHEQEFVTPERLRLREIVVLDSSALSQERRLELAQEIVGELEGGTPIEEIAGRFSTDGSTSGAVELGWIVKDDLDPALEQAVWDLDAGSVSAPVEARGGLHVIEVLEREQATIRPFQEVAGEIDQRERERLFQQEYQNYLTELRESAYIRVGDLPEDAKNFRVQESASRLTEQSVGAGSLGDSMVGTSADEPEVAEEGDDN